MARTLAAAGALVTCLSVAPAVWADARVRVRPAVALATAHDDNLFATTTAPVQDWIWRISPAARAEYRSALLAVRAAYGFDAERYVEHPGLDDAQARQRAQLEVAYLPRRTWEFSLGAAYVKTQNAGELNTATGVERGRLRAQRLELAPALMHRLDARTSAGARFTLLRDEVPGGERSDTRKAALTVERRVGPRDTAEVAYRVRAFAFDGAEAGTAQIPTLGWTRRLSGRTRLHVDGGPRIYRGAVQVELACALDHRGRRGETAFHYARTQATLLGVPGVVQVEALTTIMGYSPLRRLRLSGAAGLYRSEGERGQARVRRLELAAAWRITRRLAVAVSDQVSRQTGALAGAAGGRIARQLFAVRLVAGEL
jgi:hypothetical protein